MDVDRLARGDTIDQGRVQRAFFYSGTDCDAHQNLRPIE